MAVLDHKHLDLVFTISPLMDEETELPRWKVTSLRSMGTQPMPVGAPISTSDLLWMTRPPSPVMPCPWSQSLAHGQCLMNPFWGCKVGPQARGSVLPSHKSNSQTFLFQWLGPPVMSAQSQDPGADCPRRPFSKTSSQTLNQDDSWEPGRPPVGGDHETGILVGEGEGRVAWPRRQAAGP